MMRSFDVVFECVGDGTGKQSCYFDGLEIARIHQTAEDCYLVEFFVMGVGLADKFVDDLETAQLIVWGTVAAKLSGAMHQAARVAAYAHIH